MKRLAGLLLALLLLAPLAGGALSAGAAPPAPFTVAFIDVGQGDSTLLRSGDFAVLVDGGRPAAGPTVVAYLHQQAVPDIDVMIATHADSDHAGGLTAVLASGIPVRQVLYNGYGGDTATWHGFATAVAGAGVAMAAAQVGQAYAWGEATAYVLNPLPGLADPEQNAAAVVLRVDHAAVRYLLTSDIDSSVEAQIVARGTPVASQILKVGHHGSRYSSSAAFLAAVQPEQAVISAGPNSYGHPAPDTLARLAAAGAVIWRTDRNGTITVVDDSASYTVEAENLLLSLFLPLVARSEPPPTPTPPPTPSPPPPPAGANVVCRQSGPAEVCAWVAQGNPAQNATETVYGRLLVNGAPQAGRPMATTWRYKTTTASCSGVTGADGVASCSRGIGRATIGYRVDVDVVIDGYGVTTWFVPQ